MRFRRNGTNWEGRAWSTPPALNALLDEIEAEFPDPAAGDGTVASRPHDQNNPRSDHRPYPYDASPAIVNAVDVGEHAEDDGQLLVDAFLANPDPRVRYIIHENRIWTRARNWQPTTYTGPNPHADHVHMSVDRTTNQDGSPYNLFSEGDTMRLPPEREADLQLLIARGAIQGNVRYYYPQSGQPSADLPDTEWMNVAIAAAAGVARTSAGVSESQVKTLINGSRIVAP